MKNTTRLFIGIFLATLVPILLFSGGIFYIGRNSLITFIGQQLTGVNEMKATELNSYYEELKPLLIALPNVEGVEDSLIKLANKQTDSTARSSAVRRIDEVIRRDYDQANLEEVIFAKTDKTIVYAFNPVASSVVGKPIADYLIPAFDAGQRDNQISDLYKDPAGHLSLSVSQPVRDLENYPLGVLIFHYDFQEMINSVASSTGLSKTGETYIARKDGDKYALHLSPLKTEPGAALLRRSILSDPEAQPLKLALAGQTGFDLGVDYRKVPVISAWQPLAIPGWAIVTKIDQSEGLSSFKKIRGAILGLIVGMAVMLSLGISVAIRRTVKQPLRSLEQVAEFIEKEKYDQAIVDRSLLYSEDEFGAIATSLHNIIEHHRHHDHRDKL